VNPGHGDPTTDTWHCGGYVIVPVWIYRKELLSNLIGLACYPIFGDFACQPVY